MLFLGRYKQSREISRAIRSFMSNDLCNKMRKNVLGIA
jgi:hypothetical protein